MATDPNNPPLVMVDEEKNIIGFDIDVIQEIANKSDLNIKIIPVLKANLLYGLIDETYDIAIASITPGISSSTAEIPDIKYSKPYPQTI